MKEEYISNSDRKNMEDSSISFREIALRWLENSRLRVKESSYVKYHNQLYNHIFPYLGDKLLSEITTEEVSRFLLMKKNEGSRTGKGGLSEKTVKDLLSVLKSACLYGEQSGYATPCRFELIRLRRTTPEPEMRVLDREESARLESILLSDDSYLKTAILISLYMGLRIGEVCALKRENISFDEEVLQVRGTMQRLQTFDSEDGKKTHIVITVPKSRSGVRDIPIPDFIMERLEEFRSMDEDVYLTTGRSDRFIEPRLLEKQFKLLLGECRMTGVNYHALRHTFATRCIESGFDVKTLSEILGHSNANITLSKYVHTSMESKKVNMKKLVF